jgi:Ni/Co efflux regulator RcnB
MGQAKQRGTFEQRVDAARSKWNTSIEVQKREMEELDALEKRQLEALGNFVNGQILPHMERQHGALMRADFSLIGLAVTTKASAEIMAESLNNAAK